MPLRHGASHGLSFLASLLLGAILEHILRPAIPFFFQFVKNLSLWIKATLNISISEDLIGVVIVGFVISVLWGIAFGWRERRRWRNTS